MTATTTLTHHVTCPVHPHTPLDHYSDGIWWCHTCRLEYVVCVSRAYPDTLAGCTNPNAPFHQLVLDCDAIWNEKRANSRQLRTRTARKVA